MSPYRITDWLYIDLSGIDEEARMEAESLAARVYKDWKAIWKEQEI